MSEAAIMETVSRMSRDIRAAGANLTDNQARYFVDAYYQMQENRIRDDHRIRQQGETGEPHAILTWLRDQNSILEKQIKGALKKYADNHPVGIWSQSIIGIGEVLAAGLLAHIDITKANTCSSFWEFAGINGTPKKAVKGVKRTYCASFRTLCAYKIGESFVKQQNHKDDFYGKIYVQKKQIETEKNDRLEFAEQARIKLETFNIGKTTDAYKFYIQGKLPPAHIHARARRYAVKLFLSHLHQVWFWHHYGREAPLPYAFAFLGHGHFIEAPNFDKRTFPIRDMMSEKQQ